MPKIGIQRLLLKLHKFMRFYKKIAFSTFHMTERKISPKIHNCVHQLSHRASRGIFMVSTMINPGAQGLIWEARTGVKSVKLLDLNDRLLVFTMEELTARFEALACLFAGIEEKFRYLWVHKEIIRFDHFKITADFDGQEASSMHTKAVCMRCWSEKNGKNLYLKSIGIGSR